MTIIVTDGFGRGYMCNVVPGAEEAAQIWLGQTVLALAKQLGPEAYEIRVRVQ